MAAQVGSRCTSRSSAGSSKTGTRSSATPGALGPGCRRETLTHNVTPARCSSSVAPAARAFPRKSAWATRVKVGGSETDMEVGDSSVPLDCAPSKAYSSRGALEGQSGQSPAAKGQESLDSYSFFTERDGTVAPREEGEESESPLREQDLKEAYIQLVHGVQEWPDGCVYRGEFGLNMKLGYGEFSWPTGETYHGQFYRDHCHGLGTYMWPDGSSFTGMFYLSHREGYGTMYTKTKLFQAHCHIDVVSLLLDHGADVNKCTDDGLTPLSISFLLYYPSASFRPNVAERTLPQAPPKCPVAPSCLPDVNVESLHEASVPAQSLEEGSLSPGTRQSPESTGQQSSPPREESPSMQGSASDGDRELGEKAEAVDVRTLSSEESNFQSMVCMYNYSIRLSREILEKSAQAYSVLQGPCLDKGTVRRMAQCIAKQRNRWLTIQLLLRRGADPNLCSVPMQVLFLAVKAGDVDGVRLLLEKGARTDIRYPPQLGALTPLHIAAALPGQEGVRITELLLHAITYVDAKAADQDHMYKLSKLDLPPSSLKLNNELGPPSTYYTMNMCIPEEGGRTALHVACEREDSKKIVKELLSQGADPNLPLTRGLGSALCVVCDLAYEHQRSTDNKIALIDRLINHGADILKPVMLTQGDRVAVGTAVDYGYFKFYQDRKIAHCPFHALTPTERETFLARKKLLEYMGVQLRRAVLARESQWDARELQLSKRAELAPSHRLKKRSSIVAKTPAKEGQEHLPFFKFCYQCGRSIGVRLSPCIRCYGILTCSKYCKARAWMEFHKKDCSDMMAPHSKAVFREPEEYQ
uniref:Ankyrin repeat and MYND domain containing 1 n=1 Tax=Sciurus vulgaris TaxID=55149 RepID=A0A8D2BAC8_SCIVU